MRAAKSQPSPGAARIAAMNCHTATDGPRDADFRFAALAGSSPQ